MDYILRPATELETTELPWLDYSKATAINTCPTWGLIKNVHNKSPTEGGRNLALEAGSACHDVFAAARFASLFEGSDHDFAVAKAREHFGTSRHDKMFRFFQSNEGLEHRRTSYCLEALATSGYYDDPRDKRRTLQNIEDACVAYLQNYQFDIWKPVVHQDQNFIGVEVPFNIYVEYDRRRFRFVGRADGIIRNSYYNAVEVHENKTGARINEAWAMSFHMSHQVTGYIEAAKLIVPSTNDELNNQCVVHGLQIPLPRNVELGGIVAERVSRHIENTERWIKWLVYTYDLMMQYKDNVFEAPQFTHSCNRYFRPCQLIPFCASSREEQEVMFYEEFVESVWDPLAKETSDD